MQTDTTAEKLLLTPPEAAERLSISERTLWSITAPRGDVRCVRIGRSVRYYVADLAAFCGRPSGNVAIPADRAQTDLAC